MTDLDRLDQLVARIEQEGFWGEISPPVQKYCLDVLRVAAISAETDARARRMIRLMPRLRDMPSDAFGGPFPEEED